MALSLDLSKRVALVTGATGQLGRVMARTIAKCGADVAIHYHRDRSAAETLLREIESLGRCGVVVHADVTTLASLSAMRDQITTQLGAPDIVVANAVAQIFPWTTVLEESEADYESQFRTCVMQNVLMKQF